MTERKKKTNGRKAKEMEQEKGVNPRTIGKLGNLDPLRMLLYGEETMGNIDEISEMPGAMMSDGDTGKLTDMPGSSMLAAGVSFVGDMPAGDMTSEAQSGNMNVMNQGESMAVVSGDLEEMPSGAPMETQAAAEAQIIELTGKFRVTFNITSLKFCTED